ncbi:MAG TPA: helix-turn-helix domain-containing protein [Desulfatiglandales bacterium]|nr:helix-turn-helix domain-containing protein [Desulfatiglandales bacterium]
MAKKKIDESIRQKVITAHEDGMPMRKIAKEYKVSLSSVHRIVQEKGPEKVKTKSHHKMSKAERQKRIKALEQRISEVESKILDLEAKRRSCR